MPLEILAIIAPVFLCAAVGVLWARFGQAFEVAGAVMISTLLSFATLPALLWFVLP